MFNIDLPANPCASAVWCYLSEPIPLFQAAFIEHVIQCDRSHCDLFTFPRNEHGRTILHEAVRLQNVEISRYLLHLHSELAQIPDHEWMTPDYYAGDNDELQILFPDHRVPTYRSDDDSSLCYNSDAGQCPPALPSISLFDDISSTTLSTVSTTAFNFSAASTRTLPSPSIIEIQPSPLPPPPVIILGSEAPSPMRRPRRVDRVVRDFDFSSTSPSPPSTYSWDYNGISQATWDSWDIDCLAMA